MYEYVVLFHFYGDREPARYGIKTIKELDIIVNMYKKNQEVFLCEVLNGFEDKLFTLEIA